MDPEEKPGLPSPEEEKKIVRALDSRLLSVLWLFYLFDFLDRANIGNAKYGFTTLLLQDILMFVRSCNIE